MVASSGKQILSLAKAAPMSTSDLVFITCQREFCGNFDLNGGEEHTNLTVRFKGSSNKDNLVWIPAQCSANDSLFILDLRLPAAARHKTQALIPYLGFVG